MREYLVSVSITTEDTIWLRASMYTQFFIFLGCILLKVYVQSNTIGAMYIPFRHLPFPISRLKRLLEYPHSLSTAST
jgi:hypothetical protein